MFRRQNQLLQKDIFRAFSTRIKFESDGESSLAVHRCHLLLAEDDDQPRYDD
jgi:hypothetical protein